MKHFHFTNSPVTPGMIRPFHCLAAVGLFMFMGIAVGMTVGAITLLVYGFLYWTPVETDKAELSSQDDLASAELNCGVQRNVPSYPTQARDNEGQLEKAKNTKSPKWISITKFASFVDECEADHYKLLFDQFTRVNEISKTKITSGQLSFTEARKPENHALNRYTDILPYDQTRVTVGDDHYINASKIYEINFNQEGLPLLTLDRRKVSYIATQAPLSETCGDFWRMIYENRISIIVALTGLVEQGRRKAFQYWPRTLKSTFTFSSYSTDFAVTFKQEISFASYTIRKFTVTSSADILTSIRVVQLHWSSWPDQGVPEMEEFTEFLKNYQNLKNTDNSSNSPTLVHGSAGVGRTGTFIVADILQRKLEEGIKIIDIPSIILLLRECRQLLVQKEIPASSSAKAN